MSKGRRRQVIDSSTHGSRASDLDARLERGWVWWSSYETVKRGTISVLAIVETLAAMSVFVWLATTWGSTHLTISAIVAPLLLLRTDQSQKRALNSASAVLLWNYRSMSRSRAKEQPGLIPIVLRAKWTLVLCSSPAWCIALKCWHTAVTTCRSPLSTFGSIPSNWVRATLCIDSRYPEELVPGAKERETTEDLCLRTWIRDLGHTYRSEQTARYQSILVVIFTVALMVVFGVPAIAYRWSLKGSAFIYVPLLWVIHSTASGTIFMRLRDFRTLLMHKIGLAFGFFSIGIVLFRWLARSPWSSLCEWLSTNVPLFAQYANAVTIPRWQITAAANGLIGIILFLVADWVTRGVKQRREVDKKPWSTVFRSVVFARAILSVYTIACILYVTASTIEQLVWPQLGDQWFPWSE